MMFNISMTSTTTSILSDERNAGMRKMLSICSYEDFHFYLSLNVIALAVEHEAGITISSL